MNTEQPKQCRPTVIIEVVCLIMGVMATTSLTVAIQFRQQLPDQLFEFIRGGQVGGILIGLGILAGFVAIPLTIANALLGRWELRTIRMLLIALFFISLPICASVT